MSTCRSRPFNPSASTSGGGTYFADFGEDAYGNLQITFPADVTAGEMDVRLGEKLSTDGSIDRKPPGSVNFCRMRLRIQPGVRTYRLAIPSMPRHAVPQAVKMPPEIGQVTPFRYAEIDGSALPLDKNSLRQLFVHAPFDDDAASFECSDETLNTVWKLCHHTMKATTAFGIYIDGERERTPYEADAYINLLSHYACDLDPRVARATFERLLQYPTRPVEWSLHMPMIAAADYEATGDPVLAAQHFDALKQKLLMNRARPDGLLQAYSIVDWPAAERDGYNDGGASPRDSREIGPEVNTVANAFYFHALRQMATLAKALGRGADAAQFERTSDQVAQAFQRVFFDPARGLYVDGEGSTHASLHANMFPLAFGLVPPQHQKSVADFVESRGMACSVYGAQYLLEAMFTAGRETAAVRLMTARTDRSWCHMVDLGSTMTLEAWDASIKPNLTWNHAWGSAPANIISRYVLGVRPLAPGYREILIAPQLGPLQWVRGKVPTPFGPVKVECESMGRLMTVDVPPGVFARVVDSCVPDAEIFIDGIKRRMAPNQQQAVFEMISSGKHIIRQ